jgi:phosphatidylinositol alpha-mannosyltransferase
MRIALVTEFYFPHLGGVTEHVHNLAKRLISLGHHAIIITSLMASGGDGADADMPGADGPAVRRVGTSRVIYSAGSFARITTGLGLRRQIRLHLEQEQIDIVHVHGGLAPVLGLTAPSAAAERGLPVVATFHSWFRRSALCRIFRRPLQRRLDQHAAAIAVSQPVVDAHARYFDADWNIIPNGIDTEFFRPSPPPASDRRGSELLFLGRLDPRNGLDTILTAMPMVLARYPDTRLMVAGDGPLRPLYERMASPLGEHVSFLGRVNGDRPSHFSRADLYVCPTTKASFGVTLLEAMACGTPIAASDITGFRELVNGGEEAVLVPPGQPAEWAETVVELLGDQERRRRMGQAGLAKAAGYSWPLVTERILQVYRQVLGC